MGRIGTGELVLILIIALIIVGPSKLPELGKAMGKTLSEFKNFSKDIKEDLSLDDKTKKNEKVDTAKKNENEDKKENDDI
ncbi:MAG: twin-arginine translocase TatA/TatE family subunit [Sedimentibacter sp.]